MQPDSGRRTSSPPPVRIEPDEDALIQNAIAKARIGRQERDVQILIVVLDREGCVPLTER